MDRFNWVNPSEYSLKSGKKIIGTYNVYSPIEYTSYELTAGDKEYFDNLNKRYQYSATRSNAISEVYRNLYESGDYKSEQSRRTVAEVLHYTFPEFSEDYFYNNAESFIKNATGVDANIETYSEHIKNVWNSAWLKTGTSLDLATLYIKGFLTGELDDSSFQKSKQIIMNRTRTNGQNYRVEDNEDMGIPFIGKMWSKVVEQSPNILPNIAVSLLTGGAAQGLSLFGKATQATINVLKRGRQIGTALYTGLSEMGSTALEMANYGFDDDVIFYTSILQGIFTGTLETFLEDKVFSGFNNYLDSIAGLKAPDGSEIVDYSFKSAIRKFASSYGKEFVPELGEEAIESISSDALYNIGVAIQNSRSKKSGNTSGLLQFKSPEEFAKNAWESAAEAMWSAGFTSFGGAFMDVASDRNNYRAAKYSNVTDPNKDTTGYSKMAVRTSALSSFVDKNNVATESEMVITKANPVSLIRIGSKVFPEQKFDKYQNFAVQNGKYVFADVKTFDIIPKEEITNEDDGIRIKASEADTSLALMAKSNLISSYAYIDSKGNVSSENNGDAVRLAVKNENGIFYYNIENDLSNVNDKSSKSKKATKDSKEKTTVQDNPASAEPVQDNQNTSNQKQDDKVSAPKQDGFNVVDALDDENDNDIIIAQNSISKLVAGNTGIITLKKMSENASKKNADGNGYYTDEVHYVGGNGNILDSSEDASYIAVKRSDKPSYDLIKIGSRNSADKIIKELKNASNKKSEVIDKKKDSNEKSLSTATVVKQENDVPVQVDNNNKQESAENKSKTTEKEDNNTINEPQDSGENKDDKSKLEEPVGQTIEKETKNETKETENEQTDFKEEEKITKNDETEIELDKKDKDVSLKIDKNPFDLKQDNKDIENNPPKSSEKLEETDMEGGKTIEKDEDSESPTVTSTEIENESLKNSGDTSEKQKKIVATVVDSGISGNPLDESGKAMEDKEIPSAEKSKTPEAYVLKIGDLALSFDSVNTKTALKTLFGTKYESIENKSEKLFDIMSKRLNGESTGSKARDVLVDKILALAKAEWIVDRQKNNIDSSTISRIDEFFGTNPKDEKIESEEKTTPANKVKEIPASVNGLDIKTAIESANKVISEAFYEFTSKTDNTVKRKSFLTSSEIQTLSEMLYLNGSTIKETIDSIFRKRVKIYSDLVIGKGKNKAITKSSIITASKNLIEAKAKMLSVADSDDVALKKKFATDYITKAVDASLIYYLNTLKDTDINYFIELKDNSGDPISSELVLSNGKTNWNYAPLTIISNAEKYSDISNTKTASEVAESKSGQVNVKSEGSTSEGTSETAKENKAVEPKEKKPLFIEIGGKHVFDSKELSRNIVETTGIDEETAEILSEVASSYSPSVQENIYQASKGTVFSPTAFESQTGSTVTGAFDVNEKTIKVTNDTDAPTVIHELGHFVWHTNPEVAENITSAFSDCTDDSEIEQFRKYIDERLPLFKSLLGNYFENVTADEIIDFITDYTDSNVDYSDIVFRRDASDNSEESIQHSKESIVFEEIVMAFMEAYHLDNQMMADTKSESLTSMPSRLVSALKKLGDIFRRAYEKVFGSSFNPDVEMNEVLRDAFNELYSEDGYSGEGNVYTEGSYSDYDSTRYRKISDNKLIETLENDDKVTAYRAMQLIDGKLYPPMAAKINGEFVESSEIGNWYIADENPDLVDEDGNFKLDKGGKDSEGKKLKDIYARYNPYWHTSLTMLNDQFSSAYKRPNLVTVEVEIPKSELTSGYKAYKAKDSVGIVDWKIGPVSSKLAKFGKKRKVILSRYVKINRIVQDSEVAKSIADTINGTGIAIPDNTVTPTVLMELKKLGVEIEETKIVNEHNILMNNINEENIRFRSVNNLVDIGRKNSGYTYNEANIDYYTDYLASKLVSIDRSKGRTSTSYDESVKKFMPYRVNGIFRKADVEILMDKMDKSGYFDGIKNDLTNLSDATLHEIKMQTVEKLIYSRQTPIQEGARLRKLANEFRKNAIDLTTGKFKTTGGNVLTVDDVRSLKNSDNKFDKKLYDSFIALESFFFGKNGWLSEIYRNSSNMSAIFKNKQTHLDKMKDRLFDDIRNAPEEFSNRFKSKLVNPTQEFKESFITSQNGTTIRNGISGDTRIDVLYYLMDTLVDEKGNPVAWVEAPSSNSVIRKDGGLYHGLLVDMMNYAMTDDNAKVFSKDPYSTIDVSYAKASSMMMSLYGKEINNMSNQDINVYLFNNSMNNLIEYISDVNELGKEVANNNVSALLNANTSEEFLDNYIDSMTSAIGSITMTNRTLSDLDKTISEGKAEVDEIISAFSDAAKLVKNLGDVDKLSKENVKLSKDIESIRDRGNATIDKLKKKITEQNETIKNQIKSISELTKKVDEGNVVLFNSQIKDMMESHRNEIHDLKEQISSLQEKLNSYSDENLYKVIDDYANINKKLEAAYKANKELRERLKFINDNITDNSLLDEATRTRNMLNEMRDYIKGKAKPEGNAFEAQMSIFYDTFNTRYDLGAKKIIDPNKVFSASIIKSYEYIGASTDNIHELCNRLLKFAYNSGMVSRVEGDRNHLEVTRTINSLDIQQISELMGILAEMESDAKKAFKEYSERKSLQENSIYKAITDDLSAKSKNEMSLEEFSSNFKTGSEQTNARFQKNPLFKAFGMVETVAPKLREMSPALYSVIFGGYVNGKYNDMNLVEAYNNEMKFEEERFDRSFSEIADILNRYENTDKYTADYVATHLESLFSGKLDMGSLSIEEFESLHGNLSLIDGNGNIYMNSTNDDFVELARFVTEYKKEINRLNTKIMKSTERFEALVEYYNIDRNDIEHASENPEIKTSDLKFLESYSANIETWTNKVEMLKQQLEQPNKEGFTYTINSAMDIYLIARQEGGIERLMKDVKVDNPSNNVKNNLTLGNILYVFDLFNSPEMKKYLDVMNVLQKELASRRFEIEAVRYRSHNKMLDLVESYYTYDVDDTKLGYLPNIGTPSTDSLDYLDNVLSVGNVNDRMTKGRENVKNQNLNLNAIGTFINQIKKQERYIAFYETMSFLNSLVKTDSSRDITTALMYAFGDQQGVLIKDEIVSMLKSIAHKNGNSGPATTLINGLRTTQVYKSLGFSIVSGIVQTPAYLLVVDDIGAKNAARYFSEYFRESAWFGIRNFGTDRVSIAEQLINEYAPQMKEFKTTMTMLPKDSFTGKLIRKIGNIFDVEDKGVELSEEFNAKFRRVPFKFIDFMNRNIAYATWYAYYKTYLNQNPNRMTDPEYIKYCANEATQKTMDITPSTLEKDRAVLYNESDTTIKQLLLFTHQNNKIFNKLISKWYGKKYGEGNAKEIAKTLGVMALVSAVSAAFNGYAFAHDDEDDRGFVPNLVRKTAEYVILEYADIILPVAGGMIKDFHEGYGFMSNTPIIGTASELYSVLTEKKKGKNWNQKLATAFSNLISEVLSAMELPGGIVNKVYRSFRDGTPLWLLNYNWAKVGM